MACVCLWVLVGVGIFTLVLSGEGEDTLVIDRRWLESVRSWMGCSLVTEYAPGSDPLVQEEKIGNIEGDCFYMASVGMSLPPDERIYARGCNQATRGMWLLITPQFTQLSWVSGEARKAMAADMFGLPYGSHGFDWRIREMGFRPSKENSKIVVKYEETGANWNYFEEYVLDPARSNQPAEYILIRTRADGTSESLEINVEDWIEVKGIWLPRKLVTVYRSLKEAQGTWKETYRIVREFHQWLVNDPISRSYIDLHPPIGAVISGEERNYGLPREWSWLR